MKNPIIATDSGVTAEAGATLPIAAVERDTGLPKDTLRVWERRYAFPRPARDAAGERAYPIEQLEKLRLLKRLLDGGHRPGRVVPLPMDELQRLAQVGARPAAGAAGVGADAAELDTLLDLIRRHDAGALRAELARRQSRHGLAHLVHDVVAPLNVQIGEAWVRGQLEVFEEHLYTQVVQGVLRRSIAALPEAAEDARPRVLLTTFPGEPHALGLLMLEAVLALEGCHCVALGTQTPLPDIVRGASACGADIVALSFTACMPAGAVTDGLKELRARLAPQTLLWAGGSAPVLQRRRLEGVHTFGALRDVQAPLQDWRAARA